MNQINKIFINKIYKIIISVIIMINNFSEKIFIKMKILYNNKEKKFINFNIK